MILRIDSSINVYHISTLDTSTEVSFPIFNCYKYIVEFHTLLLLLLLLAMLSIVCDQTEI